MCDIASLKIVCDIKWRVAERTATPCLYAHDQTMRNFSRGNPYTSHHGLRIRGATFRCHPSSFQTSWASCPIVNLCGASLSGSLPLFPDNRSYKIKPVSGAVRSAVIISPILLGEEAEYLFMGALSHIGPRPEFRSSRGGGPDPRHGRCVYR